MSEPIKNTLFRFATMRTPELIPEKEKRDYHIHHPNPTTTGFFASALANPAATQAAQLAALTTLAAGFTNTALKTTQEIKTYVGDAFFDFSVWLAKNHTAVFNKTAAPYGGTMPAVLNNTKILGLWDNLFYQLIKGISPQLRQFCIELLVANGYIAAEESYKNQLAVARVIIPGSFYGNGSGNALASLVSNNEPLAGAPFNTEGLKKGVAAVIAEQKIAECQLLIQELKQAEKKYAAENEVAFTAARKAYNQSVKQIINEFNNNNRGDKGTIPVIPMAEEVGPNADTTPPAGPDLPDFEFTPAPEMESGFLQTNLSQKSFLLSQQLGLPDVSTFESASGKIEEIIKTEAAKASAANNPGGRSVLVNNMIFPVNESNQLLTLYSFWMQPAFIPLTNKITIFTQIEMGVPDASVTGTTYHAELSSGTNTNTVYNLTRQSNSITLELYRTTGLPVPQGQTDFRFHGKINTGEGFNLLFDVQLNIYEGAWGIMQVEKTGSTGGGGQTVQPPSGYGIKRIGLADYRRVEQSVCCYLPGEVSHIENVMAREYKERSSRRLTRSEDTTTRETSLEKETQKDSASTERYELQKEIDSVVTKDMSVDTHVNASYNYGNVLQIEGGASFAYNTSREDSNHTAINYSKEVTEKALERVVMKIREERTIKIIEEFEEQQKHGYDNRLGDQHVCGVYRWIDKVYKNQVFNYGKRLMYEFMIPQPASFHNQAIKVLAQSPNASLLVKPVDPRTYSGFLNMDSPSKVNSLTFPYWVGVYNVEVKSAPDEFISVSEAFSMSASEATGNYGSAGKSFKMEIPEAYEAISARAGISYVYNGGNTTPFALIRVGTGAVYIGGTSGDRELVVPLNSSPVRKALSVSAESRNLGGIVINVLASCRRTAESYANWQLEVFNAIIAAYNEQLDAYNKAISVITQPETVKNLNPGFYRQIENTVLRKNCITYLVSDAKMGLKFYQGSTTGDTLPLVNADMDQYASMVKFIEQAFEWEIMSYKFYPFYWGNRAEWQQNYQQEVDDPIFRSFLQSGMARTIVSVRPGFEEAVMYFMATGQIWNGGQVPAIGDDLYLSIVEELKNPEYYIDETWETRVPTTLTVIQSGSIGLNAEGLPCACGDENDVEQNNNKLGNVVEQPPVR